jgi:type I restriction enzyme S subunit
MEAGERALEQAQKLLERYRQSVLKAAVTGDFTREWREWHKRHLESGDALLARILKGRRESWEKAELAKMKAKGHKPINDSWKRKYQEPEPPGITDLPDLPEGWVWASIGQIGTVSGGLTKNAKREGHSLRLPYLRVANVYANRLDLSEVHEIGVDKREVERLMLKKNDLLVVEGNGSIEQIGRVALWDGRIRECIHQNHIIKVRFTDELLAWYALVWCMSPDGRARIQRVASSTAGLHTLSLSKIASLPIPIPTREELAFIRDEFERMESLVSAQREELRATARICGALRQAVLRAAFTGCLLPQEPTDEPASFLLARIAADRNKPTRQAAPKPGRKKKATA